MRLNYRPTPNGLVPRVRAAGSGLPGQGIRFLLAGAAVAVTYGATTVLLAEVVGIPFQPALAAGFLMGLVLHFTLQRYFVWRSQHAFALALKHQLGRYLALAALQYLLTASITFALPELLGVPATAIYLVTITIVTILNFVVLRARVFHTQAVPAAQATHELKIRNRT